jgi:metallophosphoesterase superfamily enzyme
MGAAPGEVAGHLHPCARIVGRGGSVRRRCFVTDGERAVLPAFGAYAGGLNVLDAAFAGLFARPPLAGALATNRVRAIGWRRLAAD